MHLDDSAVIPIDLLLKLSKFSQLDGDARENHRSSIAWENASIGSPGPHFGSGDKFG